MLRSCYETTCRFYPDRPDVLTRIVWSFVDDGTPFLPYDNVFTARTWYDNFPVAWPKLGEVEGAARTYSNGAAIGLPNAIRVCGDGTRFVNGVPYALAGTSPYTWAGQLLCCADDVVPCLMPFCCHQP